MLMTHIWGLCSHTKEEWHDIDAHHESLVASLSHLLLVALIPAVCCYFASVHLGWMIGDQRFYLTANSGLVMALGMYSATITAILVLAYLAQWMAQTFGADASYPQTLELSAYVSTPLFLVGFATLYPALWFVMMVGLVGLSYTVYLLYTGVPILMHIPKERGFIYASSLVTCGLVVLVATMVASVIIWTSGIGPVFITH